MSSTQDTKKSELILGTVQLGLNYGVNNKTGLPSIETSMNILEEARRGGISSLDTAEAYGKSLDVIKLSAREGLRFKIFTKIKPDVSEVRTHVCQLLESLGIDAFEGLSLHSLFSDYTDDQISEILDLKTEGLIRNFGASVYTSQEAIEASTVDEIDLIQIPYNLLDNWHLRAEALRTLKAKRKKVHVRSVFLQGMFFKADPPKALEKQIQLLREMGDSWPGGLAQMAFDFVKENVFIDGVLVGAETVRQVKENCSMWSRFCNQCPWPRIGTLDSEAQLALDPRNWR